MKNIRIGNDIHVVWSIFNNGEPVFLEDKDIAINLSCTYSKVNVKEFSVSENTITWTFYGKDQKHTGRYYLELMVNKGERGMITVDNRKFINLVPHCCDVEGFDEPNITTETVEVTTDTDFISVIVDDELSKTSPNAISNRAVSSLLLTPDTDDDVEEVWNNIINS